MNQFSRTALLIGAQGIKCLQNARVAVFGIGGVGGYTVEALARSGIGTLDLIDDDKVCLTNLNRQIIAVHSTIGRYKVEVAKERILDINPNINVHIYKTFYMPETAGLFDFSQYDYVVDAIDTVTGKIQLVLQAEKTHTPIISSMGAGNKVDPTAFKVADLYNTKVCPLAKVMRRELKKRGIQKLKVVYSEEVPAMLSADVILSEEILDCGVEMKKRIPGSIAFVPSVVGLILAGEVVKDILKSEACKLTGRDGDYGI
ncbi:tRNA threonylcarbamoyladenosine dehydratase [Lachnospiraceae bacterium]|nr:tRNA threonylcarbamoyladenosine dehydratase [Lachnospiraceae bacterium]